MYSYSGGAAYPQYPQYAQYSGASLQQPYGSYPQGWYGGAAVASTSSKTADSSSKPKVNIIFRLRFNQV